MTRIKTAIPGFDNLVDGGLPKGKTILLSGTPGTCKTIFGLQYLYNGAMQFNEKGLYVSFEEKEHSLKAQARQFGWDFEKLEKEKKVKILSITPTSIKETTARDIIAIIQKNNITRLVIDSVSSMAINTPTTYTKVSDLTDIAVKRFMYLFINSLKEELNQQATTLLISQTSSGELSKDNVSEFICDGIILLSYETVGGGFSRSLLIRKMRETNNDDSYHPLEINGRGLKVHNLD